MKIGGILSLEYGAPLPEDQRADGSVPVVGSNGVVGFHDKPLIKGPAIIIGRKGSAGQVIWVDTACYPIDTTFYVAMRRLDCKPPFLSRLLERHRLPDLISPGGVPGLNRDDVYSVKTALPSEEEQQKIADCLISLDDLIRAAEEALAALNDHKAGLMQRLFPAPGETTPRLRFPEFRDAGPWEPMKIGGILSLEYGAPLPEDQRADGSVPVVGSNGVVGFHDKPLIKGPAIIIGRKGSAGQVIWVDTACYPIDTTFYVAMRRLDCKPPFLSRLLERHRLPDLISPGGVPGLNRDDVYSVKTALPSEDEQQKIADCLISLDDLIRAAEEALAALNDHKTGLMQGFFPQEIDQA